MHSQTSLDKITCLSQVKPKLNVRLENQLPAVRNRVKALNPVIHGMDTRTVVCVPNFHHGTQISLFEGVVESGFGFACAIEQTPLPNAETVSFPSFSHSARYNYLTR